MKSLNFFQTVNFFDGVSASEPHLVILEDERFHEESHQIQSIFHFLDLDCREQSHLYSDNLCKMEQHQQFDNDLVQKNFQYLYLKDSLGLVKNLQVCFSERPTETP